MSDYVVVTTTTDSAEEAERLAGSAVEARLAACAQISAPITSTYWWNGAVEIATEYRVEFKTRAALGERLTAHVLASHSYDTPEVIVTPIVGGNPAYLAWIDRETTDSR
jgi:periplasmic divalent cation tolerance protein